MFTIFLFYDTIYHYTKGDLMRNNKQRLGDLGQHWTPFDVVKTMCKLRQNAGSVFEPSAGSGRFLDEIPEAIGIEIDESVIPDHLLDRCECGNFFDHVNKYDTIIGNPPYVSGKLLANDWLGSWQGELTRYANAYLHFIEKAISLLNDNGELIFIIPDSFFSDTSNGKALRNKMCRTGAFMDVIYCDDIVWEEANVNVIIFRWVKGQTQSLVNTNRGNRILTNANGFLWLTSYVPHGLISDFFKTGVGSAPPLKAIGAGSEVYVRHTQLVNVDESDIASWPRVRHTAVTGKIFVNVGPTRDTSVFVGGNCPKHTDAVMFPHESMNVYDTAQLLDAWFTKHGADLGLRKYGRWGTVGVRQLENVPIDEHLSKALLQLIR